MNNQNNHWFFGSNVGINFTPTPVLLSGSLNTQEGCAAISDRNTGNLLFYTDGIQVWDSSHAQMPNGFGLLGDPSSTSSGIIVPMPGSTTQYYIFTVDKVQQNDGLQYSIVDMTLNSGLGDVTTKNTLLITPTAEKVAAVIKKDNCEEYWIICAGRDSNDFYVFSLDSGTVAPVPLATQNTGPNIDALGYLKVSPLGDKIALANYSSNTVEVYDFNNSTGVISHSLTLNNVFHAYGIEFSADGSLLYFSSIANSNGTGTGYIYQKELNNTNPYVQVGAVPNNGTRYSTGALQMAPDGSKIYIAMDGTNTLGAINNPAGIGAACLFTSLSISVLEEGKFF